MNVTMNCAQRGCLIAAAELMALAADGLCPHCGHPLRLVVSAEDMQVAHASVDLAESLGVQCAELSESNRELSALLGSMTAELNAFKASIPTPAPAPTPPTPAPPPAA